MCQRYDVSDCGADVQQCAACNQSDTQTALSPAVARYLVDPRWTAHGYGCNSAAILALCAQGENACVNGIRLFPRSRLARKLCHMRGRRVFSVVVLSSNSIGSSPVSSRDCMCRARAGRQLLVVLFLHQRLHSMETSSARHPLAHHRLEKLSLLGMPRLSHPK